MSFVNCDSVQILLSTNGGYTFPFDLALGTPNDGSEVVYLPDVSTTKGRIKVAAVGNVFFDMSNVDFSITQGSLAVTDACVIEGDSGSVTALFTVSLAQASTAAVLVNFATADGLATAPADYEPFSGTVGFLPGQTEALVPVTVNADTMNEANEPFLLNLSGPLNAMISDAQGVGSILDDDGVVVLYCPSNPVTRAQMAVFLLKTIRSHLFPPGDVPPPCTGIFPDVPCPGLFTDWVEQLAAEGITGGCGGGNYCPNNPVTRAQMAVFLLKTAHGSLYLPPPCTGVFPDVPCPGLFTDWIEQLLDEGITGGCGDGNYCPNNPVTRAQMAVFLLKMKHGPFYTPPNCAFSRFKDVPCLSGFAAIWIERLYVERITGGCGAPNDCPASANARGPMAGRLDRALESP